MNGPAPAAPQPFADDAALAGLAAEAAGADTAAPAGAPGAAPKLTADNFRLEAAMLIGFGMDLIGSKVGVKYDASTKQQGADHLAPVLAKYGGVFAPPWLNEYMEEFKFGMWCAGVAFQTYMEVQAHKAAPPQPSQPQTGRVHEEA